MGDTKTIHIPRVKLGSQGLEVSKLGYGCMGLSGVYNDAVPEDVAISLIKHCFTKGITFFDTSDVYGAYANEVLVGKALKDFPRDQIQIATKFGIVKMEAGNVEYALVELNASPVILEDFIQISTAYQEGTWKFPLEVSARWSGKYQMVVLVHKAGKSVDVIIRKHEETLGSMILLSSSDKSVVNIMHQYLGPFYKTTNDICTSKVLAVGLVLFFMDHISETIATCRESHPSPEWLQNVADEMAKKARSYISQVCNIFTYMTSIPDPRIKGELIPDSLNSQSFLDEAQTYFIRNYSVNHFSSMSSSYNAQEIEDGGIVSFAEKKMTLFSLHHARKVLDKNS